MLRTLTLASVVVALTSGQPTGIPSANWIADPSLTDEFATSTPNTAIKVDLAKWSREFFDTDECTQWTEKDCTPIWQGDAPTLISKAKANVQYYNDALRLNILEEGDQTVFDNANAAVADTCGCQFGGYTTGFLRSRALFREGFIETEMSTSGDGHVTAGLWLQSRLTEINAISITGNTLRTEGFFMDGIGNVLSENSVETDLSSKNIDPTSLHTYGVEWLNNDVINIYVDGDLLHTLSNWNSDTRPRWEREGLNVMFNVYFNPEADSNNLTVPSTPFTVSYIRTWEYDCAQALDVEKSKVSDGYMKGIKSTTTGTANCAAAPFNQYCEDFGRGMCDNVHVGGAIGLLRWADITPDVCSLIEDAGLCGGQFDYTADGETNGGRGSLGHCRWDYTALSNNCVPRPPERIDMGAKKEDCGGITDKTEGWGQYCFGYCTPANAVNTAVLGTDTWYGSYICARAVFADTNEDICESFNSVGEMTVLNDGTYGWKVDSEECSAKCANQKDGDCESSNVRRKHCYQKRITDPAKAPMLVGNNTELVQGVYCSSRTTTGTNTKKRVPYYSFSNHGQATCEAYGGLWVCVQKKGTTDPSIFRCQNPNFNTVSGNNKWAPTPGQCA